MSFVVIPEMTMKKAPADEMLDQVYAAIKNGDLMSLAAALAAGFDPNFLRDGDMRSPLAVALREGQVEAAKQLLEAGANINGLGAGRFGAINSAIASGQPAVLRFALEHGANPRFNDQVLKQAIKQPGTEMLRMLLEAGADANGAHEHHVANMACGVVHEHPIPFAIAEGNLAAVEMLLERGANYAAKDETGQLPLFTAVIEAQPEIVELFIRRGADILARGTYGETIMQACDVHLDAYEQQENPDAVDRMVRVKQILIAHGAQN